MAERRIPATILLRHDTAKNWEVKNPVLEDGEYITVITDSGAIRHKSGDGIKTYNQLPFVHDTSDVFQATLSASNWQEKKQTVTVDGISGKDQNGTVGLSQAITDEQYLAAATAELRIADQQEKSLTIVCNGTVPEVDIPIIIILFG